jgi:hypothetical protein
MWYVSKTKSHQSEISLRNIQSPTKEFLDKESSIITLPVRVTLDPVVNCNLATSQTFVFLLPKAILKM